MWFSRAKTRYKEAWLMLVRGLSGANNMASIIAGVRDYIAACSLLSSITVKNRHIDWTDETAGNYGISPDGDTLEKKFITGAGHGKRIYSFFHFYQTIYF